jgi:hypothetical protein
VEIQRADLTAGYLSDVNATVRAGAQTIGAEQSTGSCDPLESPGLGDIDWLGLGIQEGIP